MLDRRSFLAHVGGVSAATAAISALPAILGPRGLFAPAYASDIEIVRDTFDGLAAMMFPGNDRHSIAQREATSKPGALAAHAGRHLTTALDGFVPAPDNLGSNDLFLPLSGVISGAINAVAVAVDPLSALAGFPAPFSGLKFPQKVAAWRLLEQDTQVITSLDPTHSTGVMHFVFANLPAFVAFFAFAEMDVIDPITRRLRSRPVGWTHSGYLGGELVTSDGWDEILGYYSNHRTAVD
jgi:hypothetical protein